MVRGIAPLTFDSDAAAERGWSLRYLRSPLAILPGPDGRGVGAVRLGINEFASPQDAVDSNGRVFASGRHEELPCGLVLRSIGYRCAQLEASVPFDEQLGVIPNQKGHVNGNLFCAGWIKRGPTGVLLTTLSDGKETGAELLSRLRQGELQSAPEAEVESVRAELLSKGGCTFRVLFLFWQGVFL